MGRKILHFDLQMPSILIRFNTLIQLTHHYILYCESALCQFFSLNFYCIVLYCSLMKCKKSKDIRVIYKGIKLVTGTSTFSRSASQFSRIFPDFSTPIVMFKTLKKFQH